MSWLREPPLAPRRAATHPGRKEGLFPGYRKGAVPVIFILVAAALAATLVPVWLIRPFAAQTHRDLELAYTLRRGAAAGLPVASLAVLALAVSLWRPMRWRGRTVLVSAVAVSVAAAFFARQNYFEWIFRPLPVASFAGTGDASFVEDADLVLAVDRNGESAAYPVRQMAYHHLVQDTVGGTPLVATY